MDGQDYRIYLRQQIDGQTGHALLVVEAGRVDQINIVLADHGGIIEYGFPQRAGHGLTVRGQLCNGVSEAGKRNLFRGAVAEEENRPLVLAVGDAADGGGGGGYCRHCAASGAEGRAGVFADSEDRRRQTECPRAGCRARAAGG